MSKAKLFIENFLVYGLGGIISKVIPLIMVPIIAKIMPSTDYFGISDMSQTITSFGCALAVIGMYDAMYRMFFEKEDNEYKKVVCSTTLLFTIGTSFVVLILMIILRTQLAKWFLGSKDLAYVIFLSAIAMFVQATNQIIAAPTRMQNKRKVFLVTNTLTPLLSYGIAIPLLLKGYYIISLPLAGAISGITMEISFFVMNKKWFVPRYFDKKILKQLLIIAVPLFPNFLIYWIFNSSDRLMITNLLNVGAEGVYSVGSKLGHASQLIYTAFAGGWQYFAFSTMKEKNQVKSNSLIFEYLGAISFVATSFICACSYLLFRILFSIEYLDGYIIAPYLFLAPLLQMLFQVACNQFLVIKKTWPNMFILLGGAVLNVFLNFYLIPIIGIEGAAIATLFGYISSDIVAMIVLKRMKLMDISLRFIISALGMLVVFLIWRFISSTSIVFGLLIFVCYSAMITILYKNEVLTIKNKLKKRSKQ
ncbi:MAG: oligosaccharide flippase family protein [Clostridiales bacterium]|nr:oligosaccharide flippase family protein [Clostridiales bacterium]